MWKVNIQDDFARFGKTLTIVDPERREILRRDFETVDAINEAQAIERGKYEFFIPKEIFDALVDAVHKDYKPSEGRYTEGRLEATEKHLADMRKLLKLK